MQSSLSRSRKGLSEMEKLIGSIELKSENVCNKIGLAVKEILDCFDLVDIKGTAVIGIKDIAS